MEPLARLRRIAILLAVIVVAAAAVRVPPSVDRAMAERAVAGAEWLAERAAGSQEPGDAATEAATLAGWLLTSGGATAEEGHAAFGAYLATVGYEDPDFAVLDWLREFPRVVAAANAARRGDELRSMREVEAELRALPTVPLDDAGRVEREALVAERRLAAVPRAARDAATAFIERLEALRRLSGLEGGR